VRWDWLKHAFAIEKAESFDPNPRQREIVDRLCRHVVQRGLTTPALLFLETVRPLNYVSAQTLQFFSPFLSVVVDAQGCQEFAEFLEHRGAIEFLCLRIEAIESGVEEGAAKPPGEDAIDSSG
jgi:hypothetical protein